MAIKKIQNNFTTPEQSKRLLELGVPTDSADCVFMKGYSSYGKDEFVVPFYKTDSIVSFFKDHEWKDGIDFIHCWSVGRLIEIYEYCSGKKYERKSARLVREGNVSVMKELTIIEDVIGDIVNARLYIYPHMDFSKLED